MLVKTWVWRILMDLDRLWLILTFAGWFWLGIVLAIKNGGENMTQQSWGYDVSSLPANVMGWCFYVISSNANDESLSYVHVEHPPETTRFRGWNHIHRGPFVIRAGFIWTEDWILQSLTSTWWTLRPKPRYLLWSRSHSPAPQVSIYFL